MYSLSPSTLEILKKLGEKLNIEGRDEVRNEKGEIVVHELAKLLEKDGVAAISKSLRTYLQERKGKLNPDGSVSR